MNPPETLCWNCSTPYPLTAVTCPACGMANANINYALAVSQMNTIKFIKPHTGEFK